MLLLVWVSDKVGTQGRNLCRVTPGHPLGCSDMPCADMLSLDGTVDSLPLTHRVVSSYVPDEVGNLGLGLCCSSNMYLICRIPLREGLRG